MARIKIKIAAKSDVGLERQNNEDNFQVSSNLSVAPMRWINNEVCNLDEKGALLVVADGMGGMNAGEVASQIAIDTVREEFSPKKITSEIMKNRYSIEKFMNDVIVKADAQIKEVSKKRPETRGMGTTIVIAWLLDGLLYVSWCGDSRAYVYNPKNGIYRLTKDHSYVQQLVDAGKLTEDEAFEFPESNIITRCLCDAKQKAEPQCLVKPYPVCDGDIILLCTDGLCGMIRDTEIRSVMDTFNKDMAVLADNLVCAALNASGSDNCTLCLCQVISGGKRSTDSYFENTPHKNEFGTCGKKYNFLSLIVTCAMSFLTGVIITCWSFKGCDKQKDFFSEPNDSIIQQVDTVAQHRGVDEKVHAADISNGKRSVQIDGRLELSDIDSKIKDLTIPKGNKTIDSSKSVRNGRMDSLTKNIDRNEGEGMVHEVKDIVVEKLPEGISLQQFAQNHGMNSSDMKRLNPNIKEWKTVRPGTSLNVYKK